LPPVLGQVVTGVFLGDGNFKLKPAFEIAVKHLRLIAGMDSVDEDFTALVVYFSDSTFDEIKQHSEVADESPERHEQAFQRVKEVLQHRREPLSPQMQAGFMPGDAPLRARPFANRTAPTEDFKSSRLLKKANRPRINADERR
jgi:hypothetical protein